MSLPADLTLREATLDDLADIAALRASAGWGANEWALRAVIGQTHARCVVVVDRADVAVAVGSGIAYGPLGFVGNMVVAEAHRRRGIGSVVLEAITSFLEAAGCGRLELNATSEGRLLYERHGFSTIGTSATATVGRNVALEPDPAIGVRRGDARPDVDAVVAYDRPRFGGDRRPLLELLGSDPAVQFLVAGDDGQVAGYACLRDDPPRIGPFLAETPDIAASLMSSAFAEADGVDALRINLPPNNRPGAAWLRGLGIEIEPWDGRMGRGPQVPRRDETVYGMAVGALG